MTLSITIKTIVNAKIYFACYHKIVCKAILNTPGRNYPIVEYIKNHRLEKEMLIASCGSREFAAYTEDYQYALFAKYFVETQHFNF